MDQDRQNQLKNHEKHENLHSYQNSVKKNREEIAFTNVVIFWIFANFASFQIFHDFSTDSTCPTLFHQLLFLWPEGIFTPWSFRHYRITTEHWYIHFVTWAQKCRIVFSPTWVFLEIWNQQMFFDILSRLGSRLGSRPYPY